MTTALSQYLDSIRDNLRLDLASEQEEGEKLKERISTEFNCVELWLTDFSPVMGYATGTGVLAIAFYSDN